MFGAAVDYCGWRTIRESPLLCDWVRRNGREVVPNQDNIPMSSRLRVRFCRLKRIFRSLSGNGFESGGVVVALCATTAPPLPVSVNPTRTARI